MMSETDIKKSSKSEGLISRPTWLSPLVAALLARHAPAIGYDCWPGIGFRVHPLRVPMAFMISGCTVFNSTLHLCQRWRYAKRLEQVQVDPPPVFIIGHWRSGTTLLHELLVRDPNSPIRRPTSALRPAIFLVSEWIVPRLIGFFCPRSGRWTT
jgi:hypothetical protein